jgi:alkylation response protein AidB-like acyl-CoA dehydrogenase
MMQQSAYDRFRNTFESAHGKQQPSPFSRLLSGQTNLQTINNSLLFWQDHANSHKPLLDNIKQWMVNEVDPERIENEAQVPASYLQGLRTSGCLSAKIPQQYGGLGVSQITFSKLLERIGSYSEVLALIVSVQQLGVAQGLLSAQKLESESSRAQGERQRQKYLKQLAQNSIGAFCLTTPETGSDPSRLQTIARLSQDQHSFELSGNNQLGGKLYATLGTIANLYIMLAVVLYHHENIDDIEPRQRITAFIVDKASAGISIQALDFCGWHGLPNAAITLNKVVISQENQLGEIGDGLKIAFMNLGSGRINIASISLGMMKQLSRISRWWGVERIQGGKPIGEHELNTQQLLKMNASVYATESFLQFVSALADQPDTDIRLEAAILKLFSSHALVDVADETLQLRGGRGYESYASQRRRGDHAVPVERLFRSARMMKIGEGGSNILQLYIMRCLLNDFLNKYRTLQQGKNRRWRQYLALLPSAIRFIGDYLSPYANTQLITAKQLRRHSQYIIKTTRAYKKLIMIQFAGEYFCYLTQLATHYMQGQSTKAIRKPDQSFEQRQVFLGLCSQIAMYLSIMSVTCLRAQNKAEPKAMELADEFCIQAREKIELFFIQIKNHSRQREAMVKIRGMDTLNHQYADTLEQNILAFELREIKPNKD